MVLKNAGNDNTASDENRVILKIVIHSWLSALPIHILKGENLLQPHCFIPFTCFVIRLLLFFYRII
jgi:hypothetical protein